jgi:hypothetical protein
MIGYSSILFVLRTHRDYVLLPASNHTVQPALRLSLPPASTALTVVCSLDPSEMHHSRDLEHLVHLELASASKRALEHRRDRAVERVPHQIALS